jgi:hypothetical protein
MSAQSENYYQNIQNVIIPLKHSLDFTSLFKKILIFTIIVAIFLLFLLFSGSDHSTLLHYATNNRPEVRLYTYIKK